MRRPKLTKTIGTKVTQADYEALVAMAGIDTVSDWLRDRLTEMVSDGDRPTKYEVLLAEVLALRRILLHSLPLNISVEQMDLLVAEADAAKLEQAQARLRQEG